MDFELRYYRWRIRFLLRLMQAEQIRQWKENDDEPERWKIFTNKMSELERLKQRVARLEAEKYMDRVKMLQLEGWCEYYQQEYIKLYFDYKKLRAEHVKMFDDARFGGLDHQ